MGASDFLNKAGERVRDEFLRNRRVLSFFEFLDLVSGDARQLRGTAEYIRDAFDFYGSHEVKVGGKPRRRFHLFDCPWDEGREKLVGQEHAQSEIYRALHNFVREGASNKLILLHGPNGSAKSTIVRCIGRALEEYAKTDDGALYCFNWIFPKKSNLGGGIGFGQKGERQKGSFAYLPEPEIDAKIDDELHDHPLLLLPLAERRKFLDSYDGVVCDYLGNGKLSPKNNAIFQQLLTSYQGDLLAVLQHIQVVRFYVESSYRKGYVTVEPQMSVDATERQVTMDRSVSSLPATLQNLSLYEYGGEIVESNRGLLEFSDLLKRPLEAYKYLLTTVERGQVSLRSANLFLDTLFIGTSNEIHLSAFKQTAEFRSFRGRLDLVCVPYLRSLPQEQELYEAKIREAAGERHVAPHCAYVAAMWAILTRLRKPTSEKYPKAIRDRVEALTPREKLELYAWGRVPDGTSDGEATELVSLVEQLWEERDQEEDYEGRFGVSPREMMLVLFNAANDSGKDFLSPRAIIEEIEELVQKESVYDFLHLPKEGAYFDHKASIDVVTEAWLDRVEDQVRSSLGLVDRAEYERVFSRYVEHVLAWTKDEKIVDKLTGKGKPVDEDWMVSIEAKLSVSDAEVFRQNLIGKIGAWSLDHPGGRPDYAVIFAEHFRALEDAYWEEQKKPIADGIRAMQRVLVGDEKNMSPEKQKLGAEALQRLYEQGYVAESATEALGELGKRFLP